MTPQFPPLLRGAPAIGAHLGMSPVTVLQRHRKRTLPTMGDSGSPCATPLALDDWRALYTGGKLPF